MTVPGICTCGSSLAAAESVCYGSVGPISAAKNRKPADAICRPAREPDKRLNGA
jgi:hypothetical protein